MAVIGLYAVISYMLMPNYYKHYEYHPSLISAPKITTNYEGLPGDAINIGLVGSLNEIIIAFEAAGWIIPDKKSIMSVSHEIESIIIRRSYRSAPVSNLNLFGRRQDIAFEKLSSKTAKRRHHVRFWRANQYDKDGGALWLGAATFDRSIGFSRYTGEITHHIDPDIDLERDYITTDIEQARMADKVFQITGIGPTLEGKNAEGDTYYTNGEINIVVLKTNYNENQISSAVHLPNPVSIELKNKTWHSIKKHIENIYQ
jgi:hypothetical protein